MRGSRAAKRQGVTFLELILAMMMAAVLAGALTFAFGAEIRTQQLTEAREATSDRTDALDRQLTRLIRAARLSSTTTDTNTYFSGTTDSGGSTGMGCNRLTFTTSAPGVPMAAQASTDDFATQQSEWGPTGGLAEVSLGTSPVGNAGGRTGLFERLQQPSELRPHPGRHGRRYRLGYFGGGFSILGWARMDYDMADHGRHAPAARGRAGELHAGRRPDEQSAHTRRADYRKRRESHQPGNADGGGLMRHRRKGYILVQALLVVAGLVALMAMIAANQRASMDEVQARLDHRRAEQAAQAGVAQALASLQLANTNKVTLADDWAQVGTDAVGGAQGDAVADEAYDLGDGATFRVQIVDAASQVNVNTATQQQLSQLPLTQEQVDCLLDWRSAGETARTDGAKTLFIMGFRNRTTRIWRPWIQWMSFS